MSIEQASDPTETITAPNAPPEESVARWNLSSGGM